MFESLRIFAAVLPAASLWAAGLGRANGSISVHRRNRLVVGAAWMGLAASILCTLMAMGGNPLDVSARGPLSVVMGIYIDNVALVMLMLVSFLAVIVTRYSASYLAGHMRQGQFMTWLARTIAAVLTLVIAGNLLLFFLAWLAMSLCLHQLLIFNLTRPGAMLAARKKFIVSRCGDLCLIGALLVSYYTFGTWRFQPLFAATDSSLHAVGGNWIAWLLVAAACLKSAQFPFHSWLPDTMETPTPVSALMHAGIINAGGFLLIRLSPLLLNYPMPLMALTIAALATIITGSLAMMTQTSVKRQLAYSTVAQMGFMMLECGLGAFGLALIHLVAHGLYKSHCFLISGSTIKKAPIVQLRKLHRQHHRVAHVAAAICAIGMLLAAAALAALKQVPINHLPLLLTVGISWCLLIWRAIAGRYSKASMMRWIAGLALLAATYPLLILISNLILGANQFVVGGYGTGKTPPESWAILPLICGLLLAMGVFQWQVISGQRPAYMRALYVHAVSGFYIGTAANRLTSWIWSMKDGFCKSVPLLAQNQPGQAETI